MSFILNPSRFGGAVDPGLALLQSATLWLDASDPGADPQKLQNKGTGGTALDARFGSTTGVDTNDPLLLTHSGTNYLYLPGALGNYASTPDSAALDLSEVELVARIAPADYTPSANVRIITKRFTSGGGNYEMYLDTDAKIGFGVGASGIAKAANALPYSDGVACWVKITADAAGVVSFYHADDQPTEPSSWTSDGTNAVTAGSIAANIGTTALCVGGIGASFNPFNGAIYRAIVRNGIGGTTVFDADFTANTNQSSFTESSSNAATVTINRSTSGRKAVMVVRPTLLFGTDDYLEIADNALLDVASGEVITVMAVARMHATPVSTVGIVSKSSSSFNDGWTLLTDSTSYTPSVYVDSGANAAAAVASGGSAGTLAMIVGKFDENAKVIAAARNSTWGADVSTAAVVGAITNANPVSIGRSSAGSYKDVEIMHVAIFRSALTSTELGQIATYLGV